jgi:hypothetical protein
MRTRPLECPCDLRYEGKGGRSSVNEGLSQRERIEADLRRAGDDGVCSLTWYQTAAPNARNMISVMRAAGHHIEASVCADDHGPAYRRYVMLHDNSRRCPTCPGMPQQLALTEAS